MRCGYERVWSVSIKFLYFKLNLDCFSQNAHKIVCTVHSTHPAVEHRNFNWRVFVLLTYMSKIKQHFVSLRKIVIALFSSHFCQYFSFFCFDCVNMVFYTSHTIPLRILFITGYDFKSTANHNDACKVHIPLCLYKHTKKSLCGSIWLFLVFILSLLSSS